MKNKYYILVVIFLISLFLLSNTAFAERTSSGNGLNDENASMSDEIQQTAYDIYLDGEKLEKRAILIDGVIMLPLVEFFERAYFEVILHDDCISVSTYDMYLYIKKDSRIAFVNAIPFSFSNAVTTFDNVLYMPQDLPETLLGITITVDEPLGKIIVERGYALNTESNFDTLFPASPVYCTIKSGSKYYNNIGGKVIGTCTEETLAEVLMDRSYLWYKVKTADGHMFWVWHDSIVIDESYDVWDDIPTKDEIELYAKLKGFKSDTEYFIWVDISRQLVYILVNNEDSWELDRIMECATGTNISPTTRGMYKISERGKWFYNHVLKSGAMNWVRFNEAYLFHSVAMDENQEIKDSTLRDRLSAGCVRLSIEDSQWFYENITKNSSVFVN